MVEGGVPSGLVISVDRHYILWLLDELCMTHVIHGHQEFIAQVDAHQEGTL